MSRLAAWGLFGVALLFLAGPPRRALSAEHPGVEPPAAIAQPISAICLDCHGGGLAEGGLDLESLPFDLADRDVRQRWVRIHDRIERGEMPPDPEALAAPDRNALTNDLAARLREADYADVLQFGRGPMRRLNRDEYQQTLRDLLALPNLDIRDILPEDREAQHFNKTAEVLDLSRVQLAAYLDAAEAALNEALASGLEPPPSNTYRFVGRQLFAETATFGNRQAMFFARDGRAIDNQQLDAAPHDPAIELALFRSAHWPYYGYPQGFVARLPGAYRVRFSARAVVQLPGFELQPADRSVAMTFRARKPSGPDVSGDVRATGGLLDIQPQQAEYETTIRLRAGETFEYSLKGLPVPLARNVNGGPPTYRYPPFPADGQPGVAFQWLELEGPLPPETWPPPSHHVLFADLPIAASSAGGNQAVAVVTESPRDDARRLLHRFIERAALSPLTDEAKAPFEQLAAVRLDEGAPFAEAMLTAYKAFLCSPHVLFLREPMGARAALPSMNEADPAGDALPSSEDHDDHDAIAARLSYFLTNSRPDAELLRRAENRELRNPDVLRHEAERLIDSEAFHQFVNNFTDYWLNLRFIHRDEPDVRRFPEYRFDEYLIESMERETRTFFAAIVRDNQPIDVLIDADFVFANDRLAEHYGLSRIEGSAMRKLSVPAGSPRGGLLTQAAILKVTANGTTTSPVLRGAWIMDRIIGEPPPPPPASVPAVEPDTRGAKTIRELLALHTRSEACSGCHARFDPVGLALENFDILGGWRTRYRGTESGELVSGIDRAGHDFAYTLSTPVDASGTLLDGRHFENIRELKQLLLADRRQLARNLLRQFTVYATGTPTRFSDRAEIERILDDCAEGGFRTRELLYGLITSRIFLGPPGCIPARETGRGDESES